jgi:hypothetical protein
MSFNNFSLQLGSAPLAEVFDLLGGLFLLLAGSAILHTLASWRFLGLQVVGEIIGVRQRGPYFHGVYRYLLPSGEYCEATSVQSRNSSLGLHTGRRVPIQVMTHRLDEAREQHASMLWPLGIGLLLSGGWLLYRGATIPKRGPIAWLLIALAVALVARWFWKRMRILLMTKQQIAVPERWSTLPLKPAESLVASQTGTPRLNSTGSKPPPTVGH